MRQPILEMLYLFWKRVSTNKRFYFHVPLNSFEDIHKINHPNPFEETNAQMCLAFEAFGGFLECMSKKELEQGAIMERIWSQRPDETPQIRTRVCVEGDS